jgi:hypothetical protein
MAMGMAWLRNDLVDGGGLGASGGASLDGSLGASCPVDMGMAAWLVNDSVDGDGLMAASCGALLNISIKPLPTALLDASLDGVWPAMLLAMLPIWYGTSLAASLTPFAPSSLLWLTLYILPYLIYIYMPVYKPQIQLIYYIN